MSILVDAATAAERGLPVADYFLWNDDFAYTTRLIRGGVGLYLPTSVVVHKTRVFGSTDADPGERFYWEVRNKVWMFTRSSSLSPGEKVVYGGSTLTRWIRTFIDSPDRATLRDGLRHGLADYWLFVRMLESGVVGGYRFVPEATRGLLRGTVLTN